MLILTSWTFQLVVRIYNKLALNSKRKSPNFLVSFWMRLSWKYHLTNMKNKISRVLYGIKQVKKFLPKNCLKTLYLALIQSYISYGILIWGNANSSILQKTVSLQKRAIHIINNAGYNKL